MKKLLFLPIVFFSFVVNAQEFEPELSLFKRISQEVADTNTFTAGFNLQWNDFDNIDGVVTQSAVRIRPFNKTFLSGFEGGMSLNNYWCKDLTIKEGDTFYISQSGGNQFILPLLYSFDIKNIIKINTGIAPSFFIHNHPNIPKDYSTVLSAELKINFFSFYIKYTIGYEYWRNHLFKDVIFSYPDGSEHYVSKFWIIQSIPPLLKLSPQFSIPLGDKTNLNSYLNIFGISSKRSKNINSLYFATIGNSLSAGEWTFNLEFSYHKRSSSRSEVRKSLWEFGGLIKRKAGRFNVFISAAKIHNSNLFIPLYQPRFQTNLGIQLEP